MHAFSAAACDALRLPAYRPRVRLRVVLIAALAATTGACGSHARLVSVPWSLVRAPGRQLTVASEGGGCQSFDHASATETRHRVTVAVYDVLQTPGAGEACTADAVLTRTTITLRQPVGNRKLGHAPVTPGLIP